jgi:thymidylate synthase
MNYKLLVAVDNNLGISKDGVIPWKIKEDLEFFKSKIKNTNCIMGLNTFKSMTKIDIDKLTVENCPAIFKNKIIIILSTTKNFQLKSDENNINIVTKKSVVDCLGFIAESEIIYKTTIICGGSRVYNKFLSQGIHLNMKLYITYIPKNYECDNIINNKYLYNYSCVKKIHLIDDVYIYVCKNNNSYNKHFLTEHSSEYEYLNLLNHIKNFGTEQSTRNGITKSIFAPPEMRFNLLEGFPLLTTKKMFIKGIFEELKMFINGITDSKYLESKGVNIWKYNTTKEFLEGRHLDYEEGDMGPMYGWHWRHFGGTYVDCKTDYTNVGFDQLEYLINELNTNPKSRRLLLTTFDPSKMNSAVLPPCHSLPIQFCVDSTNTYLDCKMTQRSGDMFLGVPFNIASTSLLLCLICALSEKKYVPRFVTLSLGDAHIYESHIEHCEKQLSRKCLKLCSLRILASINSIKDLELIELEDIEIKDYISAPGIKAEMIA